VWPILEYGTACWDPFREGQINSLDRVQKKAAKFANLTKHFNWKMLAQLRKITCICALYKVYSGELFWNATGAYYKGHTFWAELIMTGKFLNRKQRTDVRKYSFVNRTIQLWNKLCMNALANFPFKTNTFSKRFRIVISEVK